MLEADEGERSNYGGWSRRCAVCRRCHMVLDDSEPFARYGEFFHRKKHKDGTTSRCPNAGKTFTFRNDKEIEPFRRKRERRTMKRAMKASAR